MQFINLRTDKHDEALKERMIDNYCQNNNIADEDRANRAQVMLAQFEQNLRWLESDNLKKNLSKTYDDDYYRTPAHFSTLWYGYLGDKPQHFPYSEVVFNFKMITSHKFEQNGYKWLSDGKYAFSEEIDIECRIRITKLVIEDLKRTIAINEGTVEPVEEISDNPQVARDEDTEPTGLKSD